MSSSYTVEWHETRTKTGSAIQHVFTLIWWLSLKIEDDMHSSRGPPICQSEFKIVNAPWAQSRYLLSLAKSNYVPSFSNQTYIFIFYFLFSCNLCFLFLFLSHFSLYLFPIYSTCAPPPPKKKFSIDARKKVCLFFYYQTHTFLFSRDQMEDFLLKNFKIYFNILVNGPDGCCVASDWNEYRPTFYIVPCTTHMI